MTLTEMQSIAKGLTNRRLMELIEDYTIYHYEDKGDSQVCEIKAVLETELMTRLNALDEIEDMED